MKHMILNKPYKFNFDGKLIAKIEKNSKDLTIYFQKHDTKKFFKYIQQWYPFYSYEKRFN